MPGACWRASETAAACRMSAPTGLGPSTATCRPGEASRVNAGGRQPDVDRAARRAPGGGGPAGDSRAVGGVVVDVVFGVAGEHRRRGGAGRAGVPQPVPLRGDGGRARCWGSGRAGWRRRRRRRR